VLLMDSVPLLTSIGQRRQRGEDVRTLAARFQAPAPNDGAISYGQAAVASALLARGQ
jgi:hypothetical protein